MRKTPERYGNKLHKGWRAYYKYSPIVEYVVADVDAAKKICEKNANRNLEWTESDRKNPNGHHWYCGGYDQKTKSDWSVSGVYENVREKIQNAEFISDDPRCEYYIFPTSVGWSVHKQIDLEGYDSYDLWIKSGAQGYYFQSMDNAKLWDFFQCTASSKEEAINFGYFLWARDLVKRIEPPPKKNALIRKLQSLARKII